MEGRKEWNVGAYQGTTTIDRSRSTPIERISNNNNLTVVVVCKTICYSPVRVRFVASDSLLRPTLPNPLRLPSRSVNPWKRSASPWSGRLCSDRLVVMVCKTPPEALVAEQPLPVVVATAPATDPATVPAFAVAPASPKTAKLFTEPVAWPVMGAQAVAELNIAISWIFY